ncbi:unnamed protein product [Candidula unifasciata]|uniref:Methyltransferase type 11 domain-containing protein n=1 Tax=Candidula unifasciata TaxID=100452 RepID=A0A8S3ZGI7_9EUPU|nr:unnamed protein product [Candidula unifasciata]
MAELDSRLSYVLYYFILPAVVVYLVAVYVFGITRHKLHHLMHGFIGNWMHRKLFLEVKKILFQGMQDLKEKAQRDLDVLEIGVGGGENFKFYPKGTNLTCLDPHSHPHREAQFKKHLEECGDHVKVVGFVKNFAEDMSDIKDNTFDAVVCTVCHGGTFFFLEHVAGKKGTFIRRLQNLLQLIRPADKGNINRETWSFLDQSNFSQVQYEHYTAKTWFFFFMKPCLYGTAVK